MQTLLIANDPDIRSLIETVLTDRGHEVAVCTTPEAGWLAYKEEPAPMIVLGQIDAESRALCRRLHAAEAKAPVVVFVREECPSDQLHAAFEAGAEDCFTGPLTRDQLDTHFAFTEQRVRQRQQRTQAASELQARVYQQAVVAEIGRRALTGTALDVLMPYAARAVAEALGVEYCKVLEWTPDQQAFFLRAGVGWDEGHMGTAVADAESNSQAGYTLQARQPVIVEDLSVETRFDGPTFLHDQGVRSGVSVLIAGSERPFGVLGAHTTETRSFSSNDVNFLQSVANVLAGAVDRARTEEQLRKNEAHVRAILETTVDGIITIDERGHIQSFNEAAEDIFGYAEEEVLGQNVKVLMPSPYKEEHDEYMRSYRETGRRKIIGIGREVTGQRKDGSTFPMDLAVSEVDLGDRRVFTGIVRDITERRRLEKEILRVTEQERRRIGQDLHDGLGQMLTGIGLLSQNLARQLEQAGMDAAEDAAEITDLIREADQYARDLARGLTPVDLDASGLSAALRRLVANAERLFDIDSEYEEVGSPEIHNSTAATHLYRIAQEAVSNAFRHGEADHVKISLAAGPEQVRLRIHDDGIGFSETDHDGAGMGVRIMNYRARIIGGTLEINSNLGDGTVVTCTVPRTASAMAPDDSALVE